MNNDIHSKSGIGVGTSKIGQVYGVTNEMFYQVISKLDELVKNKGGEIKVERTKSKFTKLWLSFWWILA